MTSVLPPLDLPMHGNLQSLGGLKMAAARVIESADLAVRYFTESSEALPDDPRLIGFLGSFKQAQGAIHNRPDL